ncbi:hypothetical protein [Ligilactobacillus ruminis]|uniref:hypothetical protein n=1 Tax=Ligilactobacillus ruminis TaxID=1623 RepID=UPI00232C8691|nr:hypothetical protein [Ligilactobacillus ruminis]
MINAEFSRMKRRFRFFSLKMQSRLLRCCCIASGEGTWKALFVLISVLCGFDLGVGASIYGQIPEIDVLPVTGGCVLRANPKNRRFARNRRLHFTGKSQKSTICP